MANLYPRPNPLHERAILRAQRLARLIEKGAPPALLAATLEHILVDLTDRIVGLEEALHPDLAAGINSGLKSY